MRAEHPVKECHIPNTGRCRPTIIIDLDANHPPLGIFSPLTATFLVSPTPGISHAHFPFPTPNDTSSSARIDDDLEGG